MATGYHHFVAAGLEKPGDELYCPTCEQTYARGDRCPDDNTRLVRIQSSRDSLVGRELVGRYTIVEPIGAGGMGAVYRGTQHQLGREVAIKVVTPSLVKEPIVIKRFLREAKLASRFSHPNAVAVHDFGQTEDGLFFLVMELVHGRTLEDLVTSEGKLSPARIVRIGTQICDALEGAHAMQIIHRDLKPQNVMVMSTGRDLVKVLDFGLAKSLSPEQGNTTMTNAGALLGTPAFMPPELVNGQECDARSDLYSLGCVLYVCASARLPFASSSVHEVIAAHAMDPPPRIDGLPLRLWSVIDKLLEKEPLARYQTAAEVREALDAALADDARVNTPVPAESQTMLGWDATSGVRSTAGKRARIATPMSVPKIEEPPAGGPSLVMGKSRASTEDAAIMASSATLPADSIAHVVPVRAQSSLPTTVHVPATRGRLGWKPIVAVLGAAIAAATVVFVLLDRRGESKSVTPAPKLETPAPAPTPPPAPPAPPAEPAKVAPVVEPAPPVEPAKVVEPAPAVEPPKPEPAKPEPAKPAPAKTVVKKKPVKKPSAPPTTKPPEPKKDEPTLRRPVKTNPGVM